MNTPSIPERPQLNPLFRMQYEQAQQAHVLLYPEGMVKLNQSASEILLLCDGNRTVDDIVRTLEEKFSTQGLDADVRSMLAEAARRNWLKA
ncbi:pyrroloquinoline quinone biosynthesis peptide chaperone PqqD [Limnobacter sp.]|uniref:pyrroloquinoline quinone biosynthesis peptide chaperone PqqD n=1 Tax=Limnobacter sp. TaxID=2003368 RepID=UPI003519B0D0